MSRLGDSYKMSLFLKGPFQEFHQSQDLAIRAGSTTRTLSEPLQALLLRLHGLGSALKQVQSETVDLHRFQNPTGLGSREGEGTYLAA